MMRGWLRTGDQRIQGGVDGGRTHGSDDGRRRHGGVDGGKSYGEDDSGRFLKEWMVVGSREDQMASEIPERPRRRP